MSPRPDLTRRRGRRRCPIRVATLAIAASALLAACGGTTTDPPPTNLSTAARAGKVVATDKGCASCHSDDGSAGAGPSWRHLAGSQVRLATGSSVTADDAYLVRSIRYPKVQIVHGFQPIMPVQPELTDLQVRQLVAYLHALARP